MHKLNSGPSSAAPQKRTLDAADFDTIDQLFNEIPEGPLSTNEELRWNSCLRETRSKFHYRFNRG